jgi:hypothetical protein
VGSLMTFSARNLFRPISKEIKKYWPATTVRTTQIRFEYGFGFETLYHPYHEVLNEPRLADASEMLADFHLQFRKYCGSLSDWQLLPVQAWRFRSDEMLRRLKQRVMSAHFGSSSVDIQRDSRDRVEHLWRLRDSLETRGFVWQPKNRIEGVATSNGNVLILGGQHRVAVMHWLGWRHFPVLIWPRPNTPRRISPEGLPLVRAGIMPVRDAQEVIARIDAGFSNQHARTHSFPFAS